MSAAAAHFSLDWLAQREPADAAAREPSAKTLLPRLRHWRARQGAPGPWRVIDLGCGSGANLRWLAPRLGGAQQWLVLDHDAALLRHWDGQPGWQGAGRGRLRWPAHDVEVLRQRADLARVLPELPWPAGGLVTASALLDLAGADWLSQVATLAARQRCALLFSLSVDGRHHWAPRDPDDARIARLFAQDQQRDKGLGPALGALAVPWLAQRLRAQGYRVQQVRSDWCLGPQSAGLLQGLIEGMAAAAMEQAPAQAALLSGWRQRRLDKIAQTQLRLGHGELLALPAD